MSRQPTPGRRYDRQVRFGRILGLVFVAIGFAVLGFGWHGTAKNALIDKQIPYLVSGGAAGVAFVLLGVGLLVMAHIRGERLKLGEQLEQLGTTLAKIPTAGGATSDSASSNGLVVAGRSTYHRPGCRLVEGKGDLDRIPIDAARSTGLTACRVCKPDEPEEAASRRRPRKRSSSRRS